MALPKTILIGPLRHSVIADEAAMNKLEAEGKERLCGHYENSKLTITLDPNMAPDMLAATLVHEVEHGILDQTGASQDLSEEQMERICNANGTMWLSILRDNPKLVEFLTAKS